MNFAKEEFVCRRCGEIHKYETLVEFPLPEIISRITSGKANGDIRVLSKYSYIVNREMYVLSNLVLPIKDFYDSLEIHNWIRVKGSIFKAAIAHYEKTNEDGIIVEGQMVYPIPFYNMVDLPVVKISLTNDLHIPKVELAISTNDIYKDWKNGISKEKYIQFLEFLNHI